MVPTNTGSVPCKCRPGDVSAGAVESHGPQPPSDWRARTAAAGAVGPFDVNATIRNGSSLVISLTDISEGISCLGDGSESTFGFERGSSVGRSVPVAAARTFNPSLSRAERSMPVNSLRGIERSGMLARATSAICAADSEADEDCAERTSGEVSVVTWEMKGLATARAATEPRTSENFERRRWGIWQNFL